MQSLNGLEPMNFALKLLTDHSAMIGWTARQVADYFGSAGQESRTVALQRATLKVGGRSETSLTLR